MIIEEKPGKNNSADWWAECSRKLLLEQKDSWELLKNNYLNLSNVQTRTFEFDGFDIKVQFNPARIRSSCANVNKEAILERECFLCLENLPKEQNGLFYSRNFVILGNPYPIFEEHFTISKRKHIPQSIIGNFDELLNASRDLGKYYSIFYNGPKCGASAPDHMHFQAAIKSVIPIENEFVNMKDIFGKHLLVDGKNKIEIRFFENCLRHFISFESNNKGELLYAFKIFVKAFKKISEPKEEPMMNIISSFDKGNWKIFIFPRRVHRPKQFYETGEKQLMISPAAVDLGGLFILPREDDYKKITKDDVADICGQVTISKEYFEYLKKKIGEVYKKEK